MSGARSRTRISLTVGLVLAVAGGVAWFQMPREEDPRLPERFALLVVPWPGAAAADVERFVAEPLEERLAEVAEIRRTTFTLRDSVAIAQLELRSEVDDTDTAWDRVDTAIAKARSEFPTGVLPPDLDRRILETEAVLLSLTGADDVRELAPVAESLEQHLLRLPEVSRVVRTGDPGRQVGVVLNDDVVRQLGLPPWRVASVLQTRNQVIPGGALRFGARAVSLRPDTEFDSLDEIRATPITLSDGSAVPLSSVADVTLETAYPEAALARTDGRRSLMIGVVPIKGIDSVRFGDVVRDAVDEFRGQTELDITEVAFQPERVEARLSELSGSLLLGVGIVAGVLLLTMGLRLGLVVSSVVPLVTFATLAIYAGGGGILHQIAVAALVVALGLLVDNAIVVAEDVQRRLDLGASPSDAAQGAVRTLAIPLAAATGTTLASFVPMYLAEGTSGDFTRAIPLMIMLALVVSYVYAVGVTPILARLVLRPSRRRGEGFVVRVARGIGSGAVRFPVIALVLTVGLALLAGSRALQVKKSFFPESDRNQLLVTLEMPRGTPIQETDTAARQVERLLFEDARVANVATVVGRSAPFFYYNLRRSPSSPNLASVLVTTHRTDEVGDVIESIRGYARDELCRAEVIVRRMEQGPPTAAPVQVRLYGADLASLATAADQVRGMMRDLEGTRDVRSTHDRGTPQVRLAVATAEAARRGISPVDVAQTLFRQTRGLPVGTYRALEEPVPIVLRTAMGDERAPGGLGDVLVASASGGPARATVPLAQISDPALAFAPAQVTRRNGSRFVSVLSDVAPGETHETIVSRLQPALESLELPPGVIWEMGGAYESSVEANQAIGAKGPIGALLLILILLAEFDSFRRVGIVLLTAPLAMLGIWPGLELAGVPFGFVALLGAIALIGIVVNAAIVLIEVIDEQRAAGAAIRDAIVTAVTVRTRPILLTTLTTISGLTPLLFSQSTLWPPLAAAMISGLVVATALTLLMVPALYRLLFRDPKTPPGLSGVTSEVAA